MEEYIDTLRVFQKSVQSLSAGGGKERAEHSQWRENKEKRDALIVWVQFAGRMLICHDFYLQ